MYRIFLVFLFQLLLQSPAAAQNDCKSLRKGSFRIYTKETGTTLVSRSANLQVEKNESMGVELVFDVKWIDECTYELRPKKLIKGDPSIMGDGKVVLTNRIINITPDFYEVESTFNFSDVKQKFKVEILK